MKNKKCHTTGTVPKYNRKIVETVKIDNQNTHVHEGAHSWLGTGTSIKKSGGVIPVLWTHFIMKKDIFKNITVAKIL
jgi:hypothetical protein